MKSGLLMESASDLQRFMKHKNGSLDSEDDRIFIKTVQAYIQACQKKGWIIRPRYGRFAIIFPLGYEMSDDDSAFLERMWADTGCDESYIPSSEKGSERTYLIYNPDPSQFLASMECDGASKDGMRMNPDLRKYIKFESRARSVNESSEVYLYSMFRMFDRTLSPLHPITVEYTSDGLKVTLWADNEDESKLWKESNLKARFLKQFEMQGCDVKESGNNLFISYPAEIPSLQKPLDGKFDKQDIENDLQESVSAHSKERGIFNDLVLAYFRQVREYGGSVQVDDEEKHKYHVIVPSELIDSSREFFDDMVYDTGSKPFNWEVFNDYLVTSRYKPSFKRFMRYPGFSDRAFTLVPEAEWMVKENRKRLSEREGRFDLWGFSLKWLKKSRYALSRDQEFSQFVKSFSQALEFEMPREFRSAKIMTFVDRIDALVAAGKPLLRKELGPLCLGAIRELSRLSNVSHEDVMYK